MADHTALETLQHRAICYVLDRVLRDPNLAYELLHTEAHARLVEAEAHYRDVGTAVLLKERSLRTTREKPRISVLQARLDELQDKLVEMEDAR